MESLTSEIERGAREYIEQIDAMGGMVPAIERGYPQREIADAAYQYQAAVDRKEKVIVGVNDYLADEKPLEILRIDESVAGRQAGEAPGAASVAVERRSGAELSVLRKAAGGGDNLMPHLVEAVKAYATLGEICDALRGVFGVYTEAAIT